MRIGLVVPHIFMHRAILPKVIFSPGHCALDLANGLSDMGNQVTLFTPGPIDTTAKNINADLSLFETELAGRGDDYIDLLRKHPATFVTLARQVQAELIAKAYEMANNGQLDVVHIYTNEEEIGLAFANLCNKPVVFTHHDPFNFLVKYKNIMPKYANLPWISLSYSQRSGMPKDTYWVANIYHGLDIDEYTPLDNPTDDYFAYVGRIIEPKGVHLAIEAANYYNTTHNSNIPLRIAGKHYSGTAKNDYWLNKVEPLIDGKNIIYEGFLDNNKAKNDFIGNAKALLVPSIFDEPFGMVSIEALACGTPVIGLDSGATPEIISELEIGMIAAKVYSETNEINEAETVKNLAKALENNNYNRIRCRQIFEQRFTTKRVCQEHLQTYSNLIS